MMTTLFVIYLLIGLVVYALTDTRSVSAEIESRNLLGRRPGLRDAPVRVKGTRR